MEVNKNRIAESELIVNKDNSIYHLCLKEEHIADNVIVVGDPQRVFLISSKFSKIENKIENREFVSHTGYYNKKRITVIGTGIGTDNIDIVLNELDAVINIDLKTKTIKDKLRSLNIIRIGTCGALQEDIEVDSFLMSSHGIGFDNLLHFYKGLEKINENEISKALMNHTDWQNSFSQPYIIKASEQMFQLFKNDVKYGMTATAPGFYAPQGRQLRLKTSIDDINEKLTNFRFEDKRICNFEMETSALYGLGSLLGHNSLTICAVVANRLRKEFSKDYKTAVNQLIDLVLNKL
jgi:uridine phosphorylase